MLCRRLLFLSAAFLGCADDTSGPEPQLTPPGQTPAPPPEWDPPDGQTVYVVSLPEGPTYPLYGWTGCHEFGASDNLLVRHDGSEVPYIAIPRCPNLPRLDAWGTLTAVTSHELMEEST